MSNPCHWISRGLPRVRPTTLADLRRKVHIRVYGSKRTKLRKYCSPCSRGRARSGSRAFCSAHAIHTLTESRPGRARSRPRNMRNRTMRMIRAARRRHSERFAFGENWLSYVALVDQRRIDAATESLARALPRTALAGRTFLDIGCGSGLFSLAAQRLGARVHSFDRDAGCVAATARLRERWGSADGWVVEEGSILDRRYAESLGLFDVVYAWGVLHHTGDLWGALDAAA